MRLSVNIKYVYVFAVVICEFFFPLAICPILIRPANGSVTVTGNSSGDTATYTCDSDYDLVGVSERVCGDDGQWSGEAPMCGK